MTWQRVVLSFLHSNRHTNTEYPQYRGQVPESSQGRQPAGRPCVLQGHAQGWPCHSRACARSSHSPPPSPPKNQDWLHMQQHKQTNKPVVVSLCVRKSTSKHGGGGVFDLVSSSWHSVTQTKSVFGEVGGSCTGGAASRAFLKAAGGGPCGCCATLCAKLAIELITCVGSLLHQKMMRISIWNN